MLWITKHSKETYPESDLPARTRTTREKLSNWWYYNKWKLLIGLAAVIGTVLILKDQFGQAVPDYEIGIVARQELPVDTADAVTRELLPYCEDLNGDGQILISLQQFTVDFDSKETDPNAYSQMAGVTRLFTELNQNFCCRIFLLDAPWDFEANTGLLLDTAGDFPEADAETADWKQLCYRWDRCPILTGLPLGPYKGYTLMDTEEGDSQDVLADFYIARRFIPEEKQSDRIAGSDRLWERLTQNADTHF